MPGEKTGVLADNGKTRKKCRVKRPECWRTTGKPVVEEVCGTAVPQAESKCSYKYKSPSGVFWFWGKYG